MRLKLMPDGQASRARLPQHLCQGKMRGSRKQADVDRFDFEKAWSCSICARVSRAKVKLAQENLTMPNRPPGPGERLAVPGVDTFERGLCTHFAPQIVGNRMAGPPL